MSVLFECKDLKKKYGKKEALKGISLQIESGQIVGLLGPNGSGKTTMIKLANGLLTPSSGDITINKNKIGVETKKRVSYLPERTYLNNWMKVREMINYFSDFYEDFDSERAYDKLKTMSKGTKEKVQLILVMSRNADVYFLDEPIGGVDPAARDYILNTIITNYNPESTVIISTHLISDIEKVLDDVVMIKDGELVMHKSVDDIREEYGKSVDEVFREVFRC